MPEDLLYDNFLEINELVYTPTGFRCSQPIKEAESAEYGACTFQLNKFSIRFRVAKTTPTKAGQFVTLWKRIASGTIQPYDINDAIDFFVICTRTDNHFGQFVFSKHILHKHDVISDLEGDGGKRAIRVYPPWEKSLNRQAQKTQNWQKEYFLNIPKGQPIDCKRVRKLYSLD
jgi:hypothetical protein